MELAPDSFGRLGLTLGDVDQGGGNGSGTLAIPVVALRMADERQFCALVLAFLHEGQAPDLGKCPAYRAGMCARAGAGVRCALHEDPDAAIWTAAQSWRWVPGVGVLHVNLTGGES
jgi:hypothetical protein